VYPEGEVPPLEGTAFWWMRGVAEDVMIVVFAIVPDDRFSWKHPSGRLLVVI